MKMLIGVAAALLYGCGPADFSGRWAGTVVDDAPCSDGSTIHFSKATEYLVTQSGTALSLSGNDICGVWEAVAKGDVAGVLLHVCPSYLNNGVTVTQSLTGGTLRARGSVLEVNVTTTFNVSGNANGRCTGTIEGSLTK